jgi:hypothetical protein
MDPCIRPSHTTSIIGCCIICSNNSNGAIMAPSKGTTNVPAMAAPKKVDKTAPKASAAHHYGPGNPNKPPKISPASHALGPARKMTQIGLIHVLSRPCVSPKTTNAVADSIPIRPMAVAIFLCLGRDMKNPSSQCVCERDTLRIPAGPRSCCAERA